MKFTIMKFNTIHLCSIILAILLGVNCIENGNSEKKDASNVAKDEKKTGSGKTVSESSDDQLTNTKGEEDENVQSFKSASLLELPKTSESETKTDEEAVNSKLLSAAELKETLKNIQSDDVIDPEAIKKVKDKFRSYDELKKDMEELNLFPKTDAELMKELMEEYKEVKTSKEILDILEDFEYLVHQYDNAQEFVNLNGLKEIVYKNLNSTDTNIRAEALKLLGSAMQHNAKVQIHALETDAVNILLKVIAIDPDYSVRNRAVFALSSLLRRFPIAQYKFIDSAGLSVLSSLFDKPQDIKIQLKIVTLLNDLLLEHRDALNESNPIEFDQEKAKQYALVNLKERLKRDDWCLNLEELLTNLIIVDEMDHDSIQRCLEMMQSVSDICAIDFSGKTLVLLKKMEKLYQNLGVTEETDDFSTEYFLDMRNLCSDIIDTIVAKMVKTEL